MYKSWRDSILPTLSLDSSSSRTAPVPSLEGTGRAQPQLCLTASPELWKHNAHADSWVQGTVLSSPQPFAVWGRKCQRDVVYWLLLQHGGMLLLWASSPLPSSFSCCLHCLRFLLIRWKIWVDSLLTAAAAVSLGERHFRIPVIVFLGSATWMELVQKE